MSRLMMESLRNHILKSELIDFVILQQDSFDKGTNCPMERQKVMFTMVDVYGAETYRFWGVFFIYKNL